MDRDHWRRLAEERVKDAKLLLDGGRWPAAYYLAGYAVECGLKACVLAYVERNVDVLYRERRFSEKCWTHEIGALSVASGLEAIRVAKVTSNPNFGANWLIVEKWHESSRYEFQIEQDARALYEAVIDSVHGVLPWIRTHW